VCNKTDVETVKSDSGVIEQSNPVTKKNYYHIWRCWRNPLKSTEAPDGEERE
jgi:hypothetical protein